MATSNRQNTPRTANLAKKSTSSAKATAEVSEKADKVTIKQTKETQNGEERLVIRSRRVWPD